MSAVAVVRRLLFVSGSAGLVLAWMHWASPAVCFSLAAPLVVVCFFTEIAPMLAANRRAMDQAHLARLASRQARYERALEDARQRRGVA